MASSATEQLRIVLVGKTGHGKSTTGNSLLGMQRRFPPAASSVSCTNRCQAASNIVQSADRAEKELLVVDTPGFFEAGPRNNDAIQKVISEEIFEMTLPGIHAFLIVLSIGARFTDEEQQTVTLIENIFGTRGAARHCIVLFTHAGQLDGQSLDDYINENPKLIRLVETCGGRKYAIENNGNPERVHAKVRELIQMIDDLACTNGEPGYTSAEHARILEKRRREQEQRDKEEREKEKAKQDEIFRKRKEEEAALTQKIKDEVTKFVEPQLQSFKTQLNTLEQQCNTLPQQLNTVQQQLNTLEQQCNTLPQQLNTVQQQLNTLEQQCNTLPQQLNTVQQQLNTLEQQCNTLPQQLNTVQQQLSTLQHQHQELNIVETINNKLSNYQKKSCDSCRKCLRIGAGDRGRNYFNGYYPVFGCYQGAYGHPYVHFINKRCNCNCHQE